MDVGNVATLSDDERRREVRRLATVAPVPLSQRVRPLSSRRRVPPLLVHGSADRARAEPRSSRRRPAPVAPAPVPIEVALTPAAREHGETSLHADEALCLQIASELRTSMRGRAVVDLATQLGVTDERVIEAAALLTARGQVVRRGAKLFVA